MYLYTCSKWYENKSKERILLIITSKKCLVMNLTIHWKLQNTIKRN